MFHPLDNLNTKNEELYKRLEKNYNDFVNLWRQT